MTFKEIKELVNLISESNLKEFRMREKEFEIRIRTDKDVAPTVMTAQPVAMEAQIAPPQDLAISQQTSPQTKSTADASAEDAGLIEIKSPMVGTFYRSPSPDKAAYVQVGDQIKSGGVVCIIEAMKLFNEIESEVSGKIVKVLAEDASPVEYDQVLFMVDPNA